MFTIPPFCTLDGAVSIGSKLEDVTLRTLGACDTIYVRTKNHVYEIFLLDPDSGRALVRGGKYLAEPTEATVVGSTFGGCMLKVGRLGVGMRMEINANGQYLMTTPLESLRIVRVNLDAKDAHWGQPAVIAEIVSLVEVNIEASVALAAGE
jgi:hypothetical protein